MVLLVDKSTGALEAGGLHELVVFVMPNKDGASQSLCLEGFIPLGHSAHQHVAVIPVLAPPQSVVIAARGRAVVDFLDAVIGCFPDARVPKGGTPGHEDIAAAVAEGDICAAVPTASPRILRRDEVHHHTHSRTFAEHAAVVPAADLGAALGKPESGDLRALSALYAGLSFVLVEARHASETVAIEIRSPLRAPGLLSVPTRTGLHAPHVLSTDERGDGPPEGFVRWDAQIVSIGTMRRADWSGGGKTPAETLDDMKHRFASGTFKVLEPPRTHWEIVRALPAAPGVVHELFAGVGGAGGNFNLGGDARSASAAATTTSTSRKLSAPSPVAAATHGLMAAPASAAVHAHQHAPDGAPSSLSVGGGSGAVGIGSPVDDVVMRDGSSSSGGSNSGTVRRLVSFHESSGDSGSPTVKAIASSHSAIYSAASAEEQIAPAVSLIPSLGVTDVLRLKKVMLGPDCDILLRMDDGSAQQASE